MNRVMKRLALLVGFGGICVASGHPATPPADPVEATWKARSEVARTRLEKGGLDPCDLAVERAFQSHEREVEGAKRHFSLDIELDGARLIATYEYSGGKLAVFSLTGVPSSWALYQKAGSKTLTFQLGEGRCAFDLCTAGPTPDGPCNKADIVAP